MSEASPRRVAVFGGVYNNHLSLDAVLADARAQGADAIYNLGDVGGFGPHPNLSVARLRDERDVLTMQGNYDQSIGEGLDDCQCGYTDPRDNHFAQISYEYTLANTADDHRRWLAALPSGFRLEIGGRRVMMAHGSPRRINEFLWASTTPEPFIKRLLDENDADLICVTHTGIQWQRTLADDPSRGLVNVGAIGRPPNDGDTAVWYAMLHATDDPSRPIEVELRSVAYDHERLAAEMRAEKLPEEFVETILTGWWTTCLEILPAKERARSRF